MKTVLVTGVTGFLGEYIVKELKEKYSIVGVGRNESRLKDLKEKEQIDIIKMDLASKEDILNLPKADIVVHAASLSTVWGSWEDFYNSNILATKNLIEYSKQKGIKRFVYISSPSIYSETKDRFNVKEDEFNPDNELNYYIKSKIMAEKLLLESMTDDFEVVIIRPKGLIGVGDTSIVPRIIYANEKIGIPVFSKDKDIVVDLTSVRNVAYAIHLCLEKEGIKGEIFNITNGEPMPQKILIDKVMGELGITVKYKKLPFRFIYCFASFLEIVYKTFRIKKEPILTKYTVCTLAFSQTLNIDKAKIKLGYQPKISLFDEIKVLTENSKRSE